MTGNEIETERKRLEMLIYRLAFLSDVSWDAITRIEKGITKCPGKRTISAIEKVFKEYKKENYE